MGSGLGYPFHPGLCIQKQPTASSADDGLPIGAIRGILTRFCGRFQNNTDIIRNSTHANRQPPGPAVKVSHCGMEKIVPVTYRIRFGGPRNHPSPPAASGMGVRYGQLASPKLYSVNPLFFLLSPAQLSYLRRR
jgi:hypothetical protein